MTRLTMILMAVTLTTACAVDVDPAGEIEAEEIEAEATAFEFEASTPVVNPEGPGSCAGWASGANPGYVVVPAECVAGVKYFYKGDPWIVEDAELDDAAAPEADGSFGE